MNIAELDTDIIAAFAETRRIACVGASPNPSRPSNYVSAFLRDQGYEVIPVNPGHAGKIWEGQMVYAALRDVPGPVDMVDVFRASEAVPGIVDEILAFVPSVKTIWMQLGVSHPEAAAKAEAAGLRVFQNRCPKIDIPRLGLLRQSRSR
jgi:predicted CoA-binding protein